ncbi:hypothetical protein PO124_28795 [Bacillus licheniformis]|nr:hypothetical protein [Bacillus licheniformis]
MTDGTKKMCPYYRKQPRRRQSSSAEVAETATISSSTMLEAKSGP